MTTYYLGVCHVFEKRKRRIRVSAAAFSECGAEGET